MCTDKSSETSMWLEQHNTLTAQDKSLNIVQQKEHVYLTYAFPLLHFLELISFVQQKPVELQKLQYSSDTSHQLQVELHSQLAPREQKY